MASSPENQITCIKCSNVLGFEFLKKKCPNPNCDYVFGTKRNETGVIFSRRHLMADRKRYEEETMSAQEVKKECGFTKKEILCLPSTSKYGKVRYHRSVVLEFLKKNGAAKKKRIQGTLL